MRISALLALVALTCLLVFGRPVLADSPADHTAKSDSPVSSLLREYIEHRQNAESRTDRQPASDAVTRSQSEAGFKTRDAPAATTSPQSDTTDNPVRFDSSGNVQVYIHLENSTDATLQQLRDLGATIEVTNSDRNVVQAWVPASALDQLAALGAVQEITPPDYGVTKTGSVNTEGDGLHRADLARVFSGLTGSGVRVGVISDGVDAWQTARASGDLPSSIEIDPDLPGSDHEGTALLEIVHDLAPGAQLAFSGAPTSLDMVESILWLANEAFDGEGADIIVDDLGYYNEPYFEDGAVALAAADAVAGGAVFVSAGGNNADKHYDGQFSDDGNGYHDFDPSSATDIALRIDVGLWVTLQWNDQFGSSGNDYDLFLCPPGLKPVKFNLQNGVCESSTRGQDGNDDPRESISTVFSRFTGYPVGDVYIRKYEDGDEDKRLKLFVLSGEVLEHGVAEGGIVGHPAAGGVLAVGAIGASEPGNDEPESLSDRGQTKIFFPNEETRNKPDVMGIDGVLVTGSGGFGSPASGVRGNRFFGTSAAAPHVAGIAALVMEARRKATPNATRKTVADTVTQKLRDTAIDLGEQDSDGYSKVFGYGRADALAAIESVAGSSTTFDLYSMSPFTETFTVDSTGDGADDNTSDEDCDDGNGNCTLRAAIQQANAGSGATIEFNISGGGTQTISPASALPAVSVPVFIDGYSQPGASTGTLLIELDGTNAGTDVSGLTLSGRGSYVRGLTVNSFGGNGIVLQGSSGGQVIVGNNIGTDIAGTTDEGNGAAGVYVNGAPNVVLRDNVISGNGTHGVRISGSRVSGVSIFGNTIGLNADGAADLGNTQSGIQIDQAKSLILRDNIISGNDTHGISLAGGATGTLIEYNMIGTNDAGNTDLGNTQSGVHVSGSRNNRIFENVIGGNDSHGTSLTGSGTRHTHIAENHIGTDVAGTAQVGNGGAGVHIGGGAHDNTVEDNTIANNTGDGVTVVSGGSTGNIIWENSIHDNAGHGIDLGDDGATVNDAGDGDSGPNYLQNYPANLTFATRGDIASVRFSLDVTRGRRYVFDFYSCDTSTSGEGKHWLGFTAFTSPATGVGSITVNTLSRSISSFTAPTATHITATATDRSTDSTSEFAPCVAHVPLPELVISKTGIEVTEGGTATYTVALSALPSADTTVTLSPRNTNVATVSDTTLTFTTTNGTTAQTVTVSGASDDDANNAATEVRHLVSIGSNSYLTAVVPVGVTDDDAPMLTLASTHAAANFPSDVSVGHISDGSIGGRDNPFGEGTTATYTVALNAEPPGDVTIDLESTDTDLLTASPSSITFTKTDEASDPNKYEWDDPQTVTLTAVPDSDASDEIEFISHEMTIGGNDHGLGYVRAIIRDSGLPLLTYTPSARHVTITSEGQTATYTIVPATEPSSDLTVNVSSSAEDSVTVSPPSLTFTVGTSGDWETPKTVTVTGVADGDEFDDMAYIRHRTTVDGVEYSWASVQATVNDGNRAPYFEEGLDATRSVPENAGQGADVGAPVTAIDLNTGDTLTYVLDDASGKFAIAAQPAR